MNKIRLEKIRKNPLLSILLFALCYRIYYYHYFNNTLTIDSESYINYHSNILLGEVNSFRTPLYPYFIKFVSLFSTTNLISNICIAQSIISYFSIIPFYNIVSNFFKQKSVIIISTLVYIISPSIISFEKCVITESLGISFIVLIIYLLSKFLKIPSVIMAFLTLLFAFLAIMLRPSFAILIPLLLLFFTLWGISNKKLLKVTFSDLQTKWSK